MKFNFSFFLFAFCLFFNTGIKQELHAQADVKNSRTQGFIIPVGIAIHTPVGEVAERFGHSYSTGLGVRYKTKTNWTFGVMGDFWFGDQIKIYPQLVRSMSNEQGLLFNSQGNPAELIAFQRGWLVGPEIGRIFNFKGAYNPNCGIFVTLGGGFMQHRIRMESDNRNSIIYQMQREYVKGYDRLNQGWMLRSNVGYIHAGNKRAINFIVALEVMYGQTRNIRGFNYDTGLPDNDLLNNGFIGARFAWFLPRYIVEKQEKTFYYK